MKRAAIFAATLAVAGTLSGLQARGQSQTETKPDAAPAANTQATTPATPQGKRPPQAKTTTELDAYKAAPAAGDPAARDTAADDFAAKYPDSELRIILYKQIMRNYQAANN